MLVKQDQLSPCEVELQIEVDAEEVRSAVDDTYAELGKAANVPGFRKGKAPRAILERYLDEEKVRDRVASRLMKPAYKQALDETKLEPWAPADVKLDKFDFDQPLVFTAKVPLPPKVELGDYIGLDIERKLVAVTNEDVEAELRNLREGHAQYPEITNRPIQKGDTAVIELADESKPDDKPKPNVVEVGENLPDFDGGIIGMSIGEEKLIEVTYPDDHQAEELRGRTIPIRAKVLEIHEKKVPELTDEWVAATFAPKPEEEEAELELEPAAVDTVDKLRSEVRGALERTALQAADAEVRNKILAAIIDSSTVSFPEVMVTEAVAEAMENMQEELAKRKVTLDDYLKYKKMTLDELRQQESQDARRSITSSLVFQEIVGKEGIKVEDDDVKEELKAIAEEREVPVATIEAYVDRTKSMQSVRDRVLRKKLVDFLVHASNIKNVGG